MSDGPNSHGDRAAGTGVWFGIGCDSNGRLTDVINLSANYPGFGATEVSRKWRRHVAVRKNRFITIVPQLPTRLPSFSAQVPLKEIVVGMTTAIHGLASRHVG